MGRTCCTSSNVGSRAAPPVPEYAASPGRTPHAAAPESTPDGRGADSAHRSRHRRARAAGSSSAASPPRPGAGSGSRAPRIGDGGTENWSCDWFPSPSAARSGDASPCEPRREWLSGVSAGGFCVGDGGSSGPAVPRLAHWFGQSHEKGAGEPPTAAPSGIIAGMTARSRGEAAAAAAAAGLCG